MAAKFKGRAKKKASVEGVSPQAAGMWHCRSLYCKVQSDREASWHDFLGEGLKEDSVGPGGGTLTVIRL